MNEGEGDRDRAADVVDPHTRGMYGPQWDELVDAVAAALAKEREQARVPFLKLAHRYGEEGADSMREGAGVYSQIAREIRRAAEEPTE